MTRLPLGRGAVAGLLLAAAVVILGARCVSRVPEGALGVAISRGVPSGVALHPGLRMHGPFTRLLILPGDASSHAGLLRLSSLEGAALEVPFEALVEPGRADPDGLAALARWSAASPSFHEAVGKAIEEIAARAGPPFTAQALGPSLASLGVDPSRLFLGVARAVEDFRPPHPLRAGYAGPRWPILVIGIDSADWDLIDPLMAAGALPNLRALRERGAWGTLRSMKPTLSPLLWTTIATGRPPEEHGVLDFLMRDPATGAEVPISRLFRRVKALWNIASDLDVANLTVAWWATWPAERVTGQMVSDRLAYSLFDLPLEGDLPGLTYPETLTRDLAPTRVTDDLVTYEEVRAIVRISRGRFEEARRALETTDSYRDPIAHLIRILASTRTYHAAALDLLRKHRPRLALVYYQGLDEVNHRFAHFLPPLMGQVREVDPRVREAFAEAVPAFYRMQDRMVGDLVEAAGPDAVIVVLSDHGFANGAERPRTEPPDLDGRPALWHRLDGVLIAAGPPIRGGRLDGQPGLTDIAPTLLALMGLPADEKMPGRVVREMLDPDRVPGPGPDRIASYDDLGEPLAAVSASGASAQDAELIARLTALGYVQAGGERGPLTAGTPTAHVNAGYLYLRSGNLDRARAEFEAASDQAPGFDQAHVGLAQVELAAGHPDRALPHLEEALRVAPRPQAALLTRAARVWRLAGRAGEGLQFLEGLRYEGSLEAARLTAVGSLGEESGDAEGAIRAYSDALGLDPSAGRALQGYYALMRSLSRDREMIPVLSRSREAESVRVAVLAANWLALTMERLDRRPEALPILEEALRKAPDDLMTLTNLGSMLVREDRSDEGLPHLERARAIQPRAYEVTVNLIVARGKLSDPEGARDLFRAAETDARPEELPYLLNAVGYACWLNGAKREAAGFIDRSLALVPDQPEALRLREEIARTAPR